MEKVEAVIRNRLFENMIKDTDQFKNAPLRSVIGFNKDVYREYKHEKLRADYDAWEDKVMKYLKKLPEKERAYFKANTKDLSRNAPILRFVFLSTYMLSRHEILNLLKHTRINAEMPISQSEEVTINLFDGALLPFPLPERTLKKQLWPDTRSVKVEIPKSTTTDQVIKFKSLTLRPIKMKAPTLYEFFKTISNSLSFADRSKRVSLRTFTCATTELVMVSLM